jgi:hypothetical protein
VAAAREQCVVVDVGDVLDGDVRVVSEELLELRQGMTGSSSTDSAQPASAGPVYAPA